MASIGGDSSPREYLEHLVKGYESKQATLNELNEKVRTLDAKIESIGPLKRIAAASERKQIYKKIEIITNELQQDKVAYEAAKRSLRK